MALREVLAKFNIDVSGADKLKSAGEHVDKFHEGLEKAGALLAGGLFLGGVKEMVGGLVDLGSSLNDTSGQLGINVEDLQAWQFAAKLNGVEAGELTASLTKLQKNMVDNAANGAESGGEFLKLGVSLRDAQGHLRDTTEVLYDTGIAISKLPPGAEQTAAAMEVFGKAGKKLLPLFSDGEVGLKKYLDEVKNLGGGLSGDMINALDGVGDNMDRLNMATTSAKAALISAFLPAITKGITWLTRETVALSHNRTALDALSVGVVAVSATFAAAGLAAIGPWLPMLTLFAATLLIVQDLVVAFNGGDSAIKRMIDQMAGAGSGAEFFKNLKEDAIALVGTLHEIIEALKTIKDWKSGKVFGDVKDTLVAQDTRAKQSAEGGRDTGYTPAAEGAKRSESEGADRLALVGQMKELIATSNRLNGGQLAIPSEGAQAPELVDTNLAESMVDKLKGLNDTQAQILQTLPDNAKSSFLYNSEGDPNKISNDSSRVLEAIAKQAEGQQAPRAITIQTTSSNTFTLPAGATADDVKPQVEQANQANLDATLAAFRPYVAGPPR